MPRTRLISALAAAVLLAGMVGVAGIPALAADGQGHVEGPPTVTAADVRFTPDRTLRYGGPGEVGLVADEVARIVPDLTSYLGTTPENPTYPMYSGAVVLAAKDGVIVEHAAVGHSLRYSSYVREGGRVVGVELPPEQWVPMTEDTMFDLASVSKLFTAVATVQLVEQGLIDLDRPVVEYIPEFAQNDARKNVVVVRQLLTHTSGMPAWRPIYREPTYEERIAAVYAEPLQADPGTRYTYSDLNLITLGKIIELVTGEPLDQVIRERITEPLGMSDTGFNPDPALRSRIAATEYMPAIGRGMVWGEVHDENAWSLNGVAGHAGMFSTAGDLAIFAQMLLNGGRYGDVRILSEDSVRAMITNLNVGLGTAAQRGLGFELNKHWYMGPLSSPVTFGHTGFTGTSLVIDPLSRSFVILLTNRVHPSRDWGGNNPSRRVVTRDLALAMPVPPAVGATAWFSGHEDRATHTLTAVLPRPAEQGRLDFRLWYDTEDGFDRGWLEASTDGGTSWAVVPFSLKADRHRWTVDSTFSGFAGRQWLSAEAVLPPGTTHVRWSYSADVTSRGRGIYVDGVTVVGADGLVFNSERPSDAARFQAYGWIESTR